MLSTSASVREFSRVDDAAIFIEDTFDAETVRSIAGASPSAVVMLSPQRIPVDSDGYSPGVKPSPRRSPQEIPAEGVEGAIATDQAADAACGEEGIAHMDPHGSSRPLRAAYSMGVSSSTRKGRVSTVRHFGADLTNSPAQGQRLCFNSSLGTPTAPTQQQYCTPGSVSRRLRDSAGPARSPSIRTTSTSNDEVVLPLAEYERLERERSRYREMYQYQAEMCDELYKKERTAQEALQGKIMEIIALSSRNEESKRFIRQMKKEMLACKERALPFINRQLEEQCVERAIKEKYENMMQAQQDSHEKLERDLREELAAQQALINDLRCLCNLGKNPESLLKASYHKNTQIYSELCRARREWQLELDKRLEADRMIDSLRREKREIEALIAKERRAHFSREDALQSNVQQLQDEVMQLTTDLLELRISEGESLADSHEVSAENSEGLNGTSIGSRCPNSNYKEAAEDGCDCGFEEEESDDEIIAKLARKHLRPSPQSERKPLSSVPVLRPAPVPPPLFSGDRSSSPAMLQTQPPSRCLATSTGKPSLFACRASPMTPNRTTRAEKKIAREDTNPLAGMPLRSNEPDRESGGQSLISTTRAADPIRQSLRSFLEERGVLRSLTHLYASDKTGKSMLTETCDFSGVQNKDRGVEEDNERVYYNPSLNPAQPRDNPQKDIDDDNKDDVCSGEDATKYRAALSHMEGAGISRDLGRKDASGKDSEPLT